MEGLAYIKAYLFHDPIDMGSRHPPDTLTTGGNRSNDVAVYFRHQDFTEGCFPISTGFRGIKAESVNQFVLKNLQD